LVRRRTAAWAADDRGLAGVVAISAGYYHAAAVKSDGTVFSWGGNTNGQLGDGTTINRVSPVGVLGSSGSDALALLAAPRPHVTVFPRSLTFEQTATDSISPVHAVTISNIGSAVAEISSISPPDLFLVSSTCGTQLPPGNSCLVNFQFAPVDGGSVRQSAFIGHSGEPGISQILFSAQGVVVNHQISLAPSLRGRGVVSGGGSVAHKAYVTVTASPNPRFDFAGWYEAAGLVSTDATYSFLAMSDRQLVAQFVPQPGVSGPQVSVSESEVNFGGMPVGVTSPKKVVHLYNSGDAPLLISASQLTGGLAFSEQSSGSECAAGMSLPVGASCLLTSAFTPSAIGLHSATYLVSSNAEPGSDLIKLYGVGRASTVIPGIAIHPEGTHSLAMRSDGSLWGWGGGGGGQLGNGSYGASNVPVPVQDGVEWAAMSAGWGHSLAVRKDGTLWAWGNNSTGALGNGTTVGSNLPLEVGFDYDWKYVSAGFNYSVAIKTDGTLWTWGDNWAGQLGNGSTVGSLMPVQVNPGTKWKAASAGSYHVVAIREDGTLWVWGFNGNGQLGDGTTTTRLSPVQLGTSTNWQFVSAGHSHTAVIRTDQSLWAWGSNAYGEIGDGTNGVDRTSPVRVGSATAWRLVQAGTGVSVAVSVDGRLWVWGVNSSGYLGINTSGMNVRVPTQVGSDVDWADVDIATHVVAMKTNGELWSWGPNGSGQVGDATFDNRTSPVRVADSAGTGNMNLGGADIQSPMYLLDVITINSGQVVSQPAAIDCGATCTASFSSGAVVELTAVPAQPNAFAGWWGACSGTGTCSVTMSEARSVGAYFTPDVQPPSIPGGVSATVVSSNQINLSWSGSTDNVQVSGYLIYRDGTYVTTVLGTAYADTGLAPSTQYRYRVTACDPAGNCSAKSVQVAKTTYSLPDTQAPTVPAGVSGVVLGATQVNISWLPATDNVGVKKYNVYRNAVLVASLTDTAYDDTGLAAMTSYAYRIAACDRAGNCSRWSTKIVKTTKALPDTQAPSIPAGVTVVPVSAVEAHLNWLPSTDNVGVIRYKVYRDGVLVGRPTGASHSDIGLTASSPYAYRLSACDAAGNCSPWSPAVSILSLENSNLDTDGDGISDKWERANGLSIGVKDAGSDIDGDTFNNYREYAVGTAPVDSTSKPTGAGTLLLDNFDDLSWEDRWYLGSLVSGTTYSLSENTEGISVSVQSQHAACGSVSLRNFVTIKRANAVYRVKLDIGGYGTSSLGLIKGGEMLNRLELVIDADEAPFLRIRSWDGGVATDMPVATASNYRGKSIDVRIQKTGLLFSVFVNGALQGSVANTGLGSGAMRPYLAFESCPDDLGYLDSKVSVLEVLAD
jgi:alpha-tubulin suppressor-like RCC1 family protein/chitodextrinase